ncbi:MAG TPA: SpoIIE family protein phosphatase [Tepidisphaeraceae bacterium]|jgi:sigma-B regulation protein RsbU (phosphoserine phosphatase)|nr:SpoIIE family protein phosphatase [Tepidisphaeraceae bacterium]
MGEQQPEHLHLTDFMDLPTLQEIQDSFAAVASVRATITDADGKILTSPTPTKEFLRRQGAIADAEERDVADGPQREGGEYVAPIIVNNQRLGTIRMSPNGTIGGLDDEKARALGEKFGLDARQMKALISQLTRSARTRPAAIQFMFLLANAVARMCFQEYQLRQRIHELTAVYNVTMMLADARDLQRVLDRTAKIVCELMDAKASSIRLIDRDKDELVIKAVFNLSQQYLNKGPIRMSTAEIDRLALSPQGAEYVRDMTDDPRVQYPQESRREGVVSMLSVGMRYKGRPIGVLRVYTEKEQSFSPLKIDLLKAVAAQAAAAIENARLLQETIEAEALEKQVQMAAEVQMRMIPDKPPILPNVQLSCVYVPCFELGGDFYDTIELPDDNVGLVVADVSGKGVPASLIMASVRAALRAQVDNVYYLYEVIRRLNLMLYRDTKPSEFVTVFYGVLDARARRLTYCNAGHPPALVLRNGEIIELAGENMVLGVDPNEEFKQSFMDLQSGDLLLLYTDGLPDGMNFQNETFGRQRVIDAFRKGGDTAEVVAQNILWELRKFVGMSKRTDDVTMVVAKIS